MNDVCEENIKKFKKKMGYVVDPLLFRLKIVKFWFAIGFANKKFFNYLVSFQAHLITFIVNFIFGNRFLNKANFFFKFASFDSN